MADARPDYFPAPMQDFQSHDRRTPESMGGSRPVLPPPSVAAPGRLPIDVAAAQAQRRRDESLTRALSITGSATAVTGTPTVIDMGGPSVGFVWDLKQLVVGPEDLTLTPYATGITVLVFSRAQSSIADTTPTNCLDVLTAFPASRQYGRHQAHVESGENVQVVVLGATTGTVLIAGGTVEQTGSDRSLTWSE